jgi:hypothetical protein
MPVPIKFVEQKNLVAGLKTSVKNWERKIEIAEVQAKKSRVVIKESGQDAEEMPRPY